LATYLSVCRLNFVVKPKALLKKMQYLPQVIFGDIATDSKKMDVFLSGKL